MPDWIDTFMIATEAMRSPASFRQWTAIATIASVLERRVWTITDVKPLYPNLYTVLCGAPASGKTIMVGVAREMLSPLIRPGGIFIGPDNPTAASFMDALENSAKASINGMGVPMYSAMAVMCTELGDLISKYDKDFVAKLTTLFDNPPNYSMPRRSVKSVTIEAPTVNILAAATPDAIGDIMPDTAWGQGFTSRLVFIYGTTPNLRRNIFQKPKETDLDFLKTELKRFFDELHGQFEWEPDAQSAMDIWYNDLKMTPIPDYGRLVNYCGRRDTHFMKLAMISAVSAGHGLSVTLSDFSRAQSWLLEAEKTMPDVFRAMAQKSDSQLLQDCHYWLYTRYSRVARETRGPVKEQEIWRWFEDKTTSEKIPALMRAMETSGRMKRALLLGDWIPNPLTSSLNSNQSSSSTTAPEPGTDSPHS